MGSIKEVEFVIIDDVDTSNNHSSTPKKINLECDEDNGTIINIKQETYYGTECMKSTNVDFIIVGRMNEVNHDCTIVNVKNDDQYSSCSSSELILEKERHVPFIIQ